MEMAENLLSGKWWRKKGVTALLGVHSIGSAKLENSGYEGHWSDIENQGVFNNNYYRSFLTKGWGPQYNVGGRADRNQWKRVDLMAGQNDEMMLTSDLCMFYDYNQGFIDCMENSEANFPFYSCRAKYQNWLGHAAREGERLLDPLRGECCLWTFSSKLYLTPGNRQVFYPDVEYDYCGKKVINDGEEKSGEKTKYQMNTNRDICCGAMGEDSHDCTNSNWAKGW